MHIENTVIIDADFETIWPLAANIHRWPEFLPHYRFVRVLDQSTDGTRKVVDMAASRDSFPAPGISFPVQWRSVQVCDRETGHIYFKHLRGIAQGMWVVWTVAPRQSGHGIQVTIAHDLTYPFPALSTWFAREIVGRHFVQHIANQTLTTLKQIAEDKSPTERQLL